MRFYFQAHYSSDKAAFFMGFGGDSVVHVKTDETGAMLVNDLRQKIVEYSDEVMCSLMFHRFN
jgi:glutamate/tyrosine decarboxylase-like PLP-dependent enzyme